MAIELITQSVASASYQPGEAHTVWDTEIGGYGLVVRPSGLRSLFLQYWSPVERSKQRLSIGKLGKPVVMPDGSLATLTAHSGRKIALALKGMVAAGRDPLVERREEQDRKARQLADAREAERSARLVYTVAAEFLTDAEARGRSPKTVREWKRLLYKHVVPVIGQRSIAEVDRTDADKVRAALPRGRHVLANRVQQVCCSLLNFAGDARNSPNPFVAGKRGTNRWYREEMTRQPMTREEIAAVFRELDAEVQTARGDAVDAIRLLALSGWRKGEVLALRWDALNRVTGMVTLTNTKTGRSERALSPDAWALLGEIPQRGPYVFPSPDKADAPRTEVKRVWLRVRAHARVAKPLHALRHTVATIALSEGVPLAAVGALLGHRDPKTTLRYAKIEHAAARDAAAALGRVLSRPRVADDVIPLYRKRA